MTILFSNDLNSRGISMSFSHSCRLVLGSLVAGLLLVGTPLFAENVNPQTAEIDLTQFGQLPVRFNGRVTSYQVVAQNYLRRFGGRDQCYDLKDKEHPAVRWLLDVMAETDQHDQWRIFKIENEKLLKQLQLELHSDSKQTRDVFSFAELQSKFELIDQLRQNAIKAKTKTEEQLTLGNLLSDLKYHLDLEASFRFQLPKPLNERAAQRILFELQSLQRAHLPLFVPATDGKSWLLYFQARLLDFVNSSKPEKQNPHFRQFQSILTAYNQGDAKSFRQGVEKYANTLAAIHASDSPFQFRSSPVWLEHGVESSDELFFYADANAMGRQVVDMSLMEADDARFIVNYFPKPEVSPVDLVNSWRITLGLVPLSEAELKATWSTTQISGRAAILTDNQTPSYVSLPQKKRYRTAILQEETQSIVFSFYGEKTVVGKHIDSHRALMKSIKIKSMKDLTEWFPTEKKTPTIPPNHLLATIVPDGKQVWVFVTSGFGNELEKHRENFLRFSRSLKLTSTKTGQSKPEWQLPNGWTEIGEFGEVTLLLGTGENALPMTITPLGEASETSVDALVDYWAKKIVGFPLSTDQRDKSVQKIRVANREAYLVDLRKEPPKDVPSASPNALVFQTPKGWQKSPPGVLIKHSFEITQGDDQAKVTVVALSAQSKNLLPQNINRWRAQIDLPRQNEKEVLKAANPIKIDKQPGTLIDLHNPENKKRILAAIVNHGEQTWYFKMMGNASLVENQRKTFQSFLKSVKLPKRDPADTPK